MTGAPQCQTRVLLLRIVAQGLHLEGDIAGGLVAGVAAQRAGVRVEVRSLAATLGRK